MFSIGLIIGPLISSWLDSAIMTVYFCIEMTLAALVYLILIVPESAPIVASRRARRRSKGSEVDPAAEGLLSEAEVGDEEQQQQPILQDSAGSNSRHLKGPTSFFSGSIRGLRVVLSSSWYLKLAIIWALVSAMSSGAQETLVQYLELKLGFSSHVSQLSL